MVDGERGSAGSGAVTVAETATDASPLSPDSRQARTRGRGAGSTELGRGDAIGRYLVLHRLGAGGMGVVYAAYDPELDRRVAIKLLRPDAFGSTGGSVGEARLVREARAMAKLAAPNVITVHDIGTFDEQVYVAMEFVDGVTLSEWWKESSRSWHEVVEVFRAAGRGLEAAHAAGLIHRDFKPENVMLAADGRILVMDFGLVHEADEETADAPGDPDELVSGSRPEDSKLTRAGAVMGTPAYMAPEQHLGLKTDARTDQFSFCVALYEGLFGTRPFRGDSLAALAFQVTEGNLQDPPSDRPVPSWLLRMLKRGLAPQPDDRYPSMSALLAELDQDPAAGRRRWMGLGAIGAAGLALAYLASRPDAGEQLCVGAHDKLAAVWNDARRQQASDAFQETGVNYAADTWTRVERRLDEYADTWVAGHTEACQATAVRGEQSTELMDKRMACLSRRLVAFDSLVQVYTDADATLVANAVMAASRLPRVDSCADQAYLNAEVAPPEDEAAQKQVEELRGRLIELQTLESAGRYDAALELAKPLLREAQDLGYGPIEAEAKFLGGALYRDTGDYDLAYELLRDAAFRARAVRDDATAGKAVVELAGLVGSQLKRPEEAQIWVEAGEAEVSRGGDRYLAARLAGRRGLLLYEQGDYALAQQAYAEELRLLEEVDRAEEIDGVVVLNNQGSAAYAAGDYDLSQQAYGRALELCRNNLGELHPAVAVAIGNLGLTARAGGDLRAARRHYEEALALKEKSLGMDHPSLAYTLDSLGSLLVQKGELEAGRKNLERALEIRRNKLGPQHVDVAHSEARLGTALMEMGELDQALNHQTRALELASERLGAHHPSLAGFHDDLGRVLTRLESYDEARRHHEIAEKLRPDNDGKEHPGRAASLLYLAQAELAAGRATHAIPALRHALELAKRPNGRKEILPDIQFELARALELSGSDSDELGQLIQSAAEAYAAQGRGRKLAELRSWSTARNATAGER